MPAYCFPPPNLCVRKSASPLWPQLSPSPFPGPVWCRASKSPTPMSPYCPPAAPPRRWTSPWTRTPLLSPSTPASWARSTASRWVGSRQLMPHTWPSARAVSVNQLWQLPSMFSIGGEQRMSVNARQCFFVFVSLFLCFLGASVSIVTDGCGWWIYHWLYNLRWLLHREPSALRVAQLQRETNGSRTCRELSSPTRWGERKGCGRGRW